MKLKNLFKRKHNIEYWGETKLPVMKKGVILQDKNEALLTAPLIKNKQTKKDEIKTFKENEMKDDKAYVEARELPKDFNLTRMQARKEKKLKKKFPDSLVLIRMEMNNGNWHEFLVSDKTESFAFRKKQYVFDFKMRYYLIERNIWAYDFNEELSLPIKKDVKVTADVEELLKKIYTTSRNPVNARVNSDEIKELIENSGLVDVEASLNPLTLKRFTDSEVIKQVLQGAMLGRLFKVMFFILIGIGILTLIILLVLLYHSGVFAKLGSMFN